MAKSLALMLPAMNIDDRTELLGGMQQGAPAEVFAGVGPGQVGAHSRGCRAGGRSARPRLTATSSPPLSTTTAQRSSSSCAAPAISASSSVADSTSRDPAAAHCYGRREVQASAVAEPTKASSTPAPMNHPVTGRRSSRSLIAVPRSA